jgi:protocatechuate 3,4-dioxygenase beta subunit
MLRAVLLLLSFGLTQVTPTLTQDQPRTGEIRGRVTDKDTGQPLSRALVRLHSADGEERSSVRTDVTGLFRFTGLVAGEYTGFVDHGVYRSTHEGAGISGGAGRPIVLKAGEVREINVALTRTFAINVRVVDESGDPLSGIMVTAHSPERGNLIAPTWNHTTDDHGRLRVFGLVSGRYILCAQSSIVGVSPTGRRDALLRTCYPSVVDDAEGQPILVDRSDVAETEIRMRTGRTFTITGRVVDASGAPAPVAFVSLAKHWAGGSASTGMSRGVDGDGRFRISHVQPGEYAIEASIGGPERPEHRRSLEQAFVPIRVSDADLSVLVPLQKTVDVTGRVTLEDPAASFRATPGYAPMFVSARIAEDARSGGGSFASDLVGEDKRFTLRRMFGRRTLEVLNIPRGWYVKSIRYAGNEIIDEPTTFKESAEPAIEILVSNRGAVVTGRVTDERGDPVPGATVLMFAADRPRMAWRAPQSTRASPTGEFRAGPTRAGDYFIVAVPAKTFPIQAGDSRPLQRLAAVAERVTLGDLDERSIDLRLVVER